MSLQAILDAINASGITRVQEIEARCRQQTEEILDEARQEAKILEEETCKAVAAPAYRERARIIHKAHLELLQLIGNTRQSLVQTALQRTKDRLANYRADPGYPQLLLKLTEEARTELQGSVDLLTESTIYADPRDQPIMDNILDELGFKITACYEDKWWGGVVVKSQGDQIVVINTLESRMERALPYLRRSLSALFEAERPHGELQPLQENVIAG